MLSAIRTFAKKNIFLRKLVGYHLASSGLFDSVFKTYSLSDHWQRRIREVVSCDDNAAIARCAEAGEIRKGVQYLHNGLKIYLGSYYGPEYARMLIESRGVHEPQEEKAFAQVLKCIPAGATMIEMGAFWSFYSMWFNKEVRGAQNYMIEPDAFNLGHGKRNFRLNAMQGSFTQAFIGAASNREGGVPVVSVDDFVQQHKIESISILHSDIQGHELEMLQGAVKSIAAGKISFIFISTHSNELHSNCLSFLERRGFEIIAEADLDNTYSEDGLIVAKSPFAAGPDKIEIATKKSAVIN